MLYGICNLSIVPLRIEASDASEMVSQVLFGEDFLILEKEKTKTQKLTHLIKSLLIDIAIALKFKINKLNI